MEWKKRTLTKTIYVVKANLKGATKETLYLKARRHGEFDTGYHYVLYNDGTLEADRPENAVAQWDFENYETSLYVLADTTGKLSDAQHLILKTLNQQYPEAELMEV